MKGVLIMKLKLLLEVNTPYRKFFGKDLYNGIMAKINQVNPDLGMEIHSGGYAHHSNKAFILKKLVFSGLLPQGKRKYMLYLGWHPDVINAVLDAINDDSTFNVGDNVFDVIDTTIIDSFLGDTELFRTVSPIIPVAGQSDLDGDMLIANLRRKYEAVTGKKVDSFSLKIKEIIDKCKVKVKWDDRFGVWGYKCYVLFEGDPGLIEFASNVGLGRRNSLGFGMIR